MRRARLLIVGCGDVGLRMVAALASQVKIIATSRRAEQRARIRALGATPLAPGAGRRLAGLARWQVYLVPPPPEGRDDPLLAAHLAGTLRAARSGGPPATLVYSSTTGVFGDARGERLSETSAPRPASARAVRRLAAETRLRRAARPASGRAARPASGGPGRGAAALRPVILRVPGIYAHDRLPLERLRRGTPCLEPAADGYSNHIHADDLARLLWIGLFRGGSTRLYIASDGQDLKMGDYFTQVAAATGLAPPPRLPAPDVEAAVTPMAWSFMRESRRLDNRRMLAELRPRLRYPTVESTLCAWRAARSEAPAENP